MDDLDADAHRDFERRVTDLLYTRHADLVEGLSPMALKARVQIALARGRSHGFSWQSALAGFTVLMFALGPAFDQHPAFRKALSIKLPDEDMRIKAIYGNVSDEDWAEAHAQSAPDAWQQLGA